MTAAPVHSPIENAAAGFIFPALSCPTTIAAPGLARKRNPAVRGRQRDVPASPSTALCRRVHHGAGLVPSVEGTAIWFVESAEDAGALVAPVSWGRAVAVGATSVGFFAQRARSARR